MRKKYFYIIILSLFCLLSLASCIRNRSDEKEEVCMYLWDKTMCKELTPWLEKEYPNVNFTFVVGYNTIDYFVDLQQRGFFPDIITCRRFSLNDATELSDYLLDVSESNVAAGFYESYLENNRELDGSVKWLPMCAEVDGYIANIDLFAENNIPIPTNYSEFVSACNAFEEKGIRCYLNDYREDYSCLEALQGCSIEKLMTTEGRLWRIQYENKISPLLDLDQNVWSSVFDNFSAYLKDTHVRSDDVQLSFQMAKSEFLEGRAAIIRGTSSDCSVLSTMENMNTKILPYYGESSKDNWLLTYPTCQLAISKEVKNDKRKYDIIMDIVEKIFSEEGQEKVSPSKAVLSYNQNVNIEFDQVFSEVKDLIDRNHLYIRLASTEFFSISKEVVQKMIRGELNAESAFTEFNQLLNTLPDITSQETLITQNTHYEYQITKNGSPAASSLVNTIRKYEGNDIVIGYSNFITSPIFEGTYTFQQLKWLIGSRVLIRRGELTGTEVNELMSWLINMSDSNNPIRHHNLLPVTSGMEYRIIDNRNGSYTLKGITINNKPIDENKTYSVLMLGDNNFITAEYYCNSPMPSKLDEKMIGGTKINQTYDLFKEALENLKQFESPSDYIIID